MYTFAQAHVQINPRKKVKDHQNIFTETEKRGIMQSKKIPVLTSAERTGSVLWQEGQNRQHHKEKTFFETVEATC